MKKFILLFSSLLFISSVGFSQEQYPYAWLAGNWIGDGFGGTSEEIWTQPDASGTMIGNYRHHKGDGSINFYEFMVLDSTGLRLKHFNPDMMGWETKEDFVHFKFIEFTNDKIVLKGLVFERTSDQTMEIRLDMRMNDGSLRTEVFKMKRK